MTDLRYSVTVRFMDVPEYVHEGFVVPRRTFYRAHITRGPFGCCSPDPADFEQKVFESPIIDEWSEALLPPTRLKDPQEVLLELMKVVTEAITEIPIQLPTTP